MKFRFLLAACAALFATGVILRLGAAKTAPYRTRSFEFEYVARVPAAPPGSGPLRLWIPLPQSDRQQEISALKIHSPVPYQLRQDAEYRNRYAYMELPSPLDSRPVEVHVDFKATRREHKVNLADAAAAESVRNHPDLARWVRPDRRVPLDGVIRSLAEQQTRGLERPLDKAKAIYRFVIANMRYDKTGQGWGQGDAVFACNAKRGNCTDFHSLFIGMLRAVGIPARFEIGFSIPSDRHAGDIPGYHCWAEFWLEDKGWVPVDASEAWKNPAKRDYFFGAHDEDRVQFTRGRDIRLDPAQHGDPLNYFVYPYAELGGKPLAGLEYKFSFRDLEN